MSASDFKIGLAGLGTVGAGVARILIEDAAVLSARVGKPVHLSVAARDQKRDRGVDLSGVTFVSDVLALATREDVDCVVELIGGDEGPARTLVETALKMGKSVVTANKALIAKHGASLAALAEEHNASLRFEAAVAGGIPIIRALSESLIAYKVNAVRGILNGTCNYILTQMEASSRSFAEVLVEAQALGYAEGDPTLDIGGGDTAHKLAILASIAFGSVPDLASVVVSGIQDVTLADIAFAKEFGYRLKLLGAARCGSDGIDQRVHLAMVKSGTPIADVEGSFNAVIVDMEEAGAFFFGGRGAGRAPTASAVLADIADVARGGRTPAFGRPVASLGVARSAKSPMISAFYLRFQVLDVPGVLAEISRHLSDEGVSIDAMIQRARAPGEPVAIVMITHEASEHSVQRALQAIARSDKVFERPCMNPMETV